MPENAHIEQRTYWFVVDDETGKSVGGWWSTQQIAKIALHDDVPRAITMQAALDRAIDRV